MAEFIVTAPDGKEHIVTAPDGATQDQALEFAKSQFGATQGGAATGNPGLKTQGEKAYKADVRPSGGIGAIVDSAAGGAALGAASSEILTGLGRAASAIPQTSRLAPYLESMGAILKAGGRVAPTIAGAMSGAGSEAAGQLAENAGAGPVTAEAARIAGGAIGPEPLNLGVQALKKYVVTPSFSVLSKFKKEAIKGLLGKMEDAPESLSARERAYVDGLLNEIRGGEKTNAPLEYVGSLMGAEGQRLMTSADQQTASALRQAGAVGSPGGYPAASNELADIGGGLRDTIAKRNEAALTARTDAYNNNAKARDAIVSAQESSRKFVNQMPEYKALLSELDSQIGAGVRSPAVAANYEKIKSELTNPERDVFGQHKPISFQVLDDVRRKLGEAFAGRPAEGYDAIGATAAKDLYGKISNIQKNYAGGANGPQARLLDEYAASTKGLEPFSSKFGKKATALDQYREGQYATDPSALPDTFFKTRASIQALKELTGNQTQVQAAALAYADKKLTGLDSDGVRQWMTKNAEWLSETPATRRLVDNYASRLADSERATRSATDFATQAAKDANMLVGNEFPAQRAVDLIKSGTPELWGKIAPVIAKSPQAKEKTVEAVRQVIADQGGSRSTADLFERSIRPALEGSGISSKAEMDFIAKKLSDIKAMNIPEPERLGLAKRTLLQGAAGWMASARSRNGFQSMEWAVPR